MATAVEPLRIPHFRSLWLATVFSAMGTFLQAVAGSWLMLELTGSATWVGLMVASALLPTLFFAVLAGAIADLVDRTKVMVGAQVVAGSAAAAMAWATFTDNITPGLLLGLGLTLGLGVAFNLPAWQSFVPDLVPRGMVASAVALNSVAFNVARAIGPAIGGLILATAGAELAFGLNAVSYIGVVIVLLVIRRRIAVAGDPDGGSVGTAVGLGIRFARFTPPFRRVLAVAASFAIVSAVVQAVLPSRTEELGGDEWTYGILLGSMGLGALIGAFTRPGVVKRLGNRTLPVAITTFGIAGVALGLAPNTGVAVMALLVIGLCWVYALTTMNASAQLLAPGWVRGRAMSLYTLAFAGIVPIGSTISGVVADRIGAAGAELVFATAAIALGLAVPRLGIPALDDIESPEFDDERLIPAHAATEGGPVLVVNTWQIDLPSLDEFLRIMQEVRLVRLRTGAYSWRLYRNADDPHRLTEAFMCTSWAEHMAMHRRIDEASVVVIRRARAMDVGNGPRSRHLVAVDVEHPAEWEQLVTAHEQYHSTDGSIPLEQPEATA
jgi:MFS family permease